MSARRSRNARRAHGPAFDPYAQPRRPQGVRVDDEPGLSDGLRGSIPAAAVLPLRFFLGAMFLYAGLDKLLDPAFLRPDGPGSIAFQLQEFARISLARTLVTVFPQPFPILTGLGISLLEIAVGLGRDLRAAVSLECGRRRRALDPVLPDRVVDDSAVLSRLLTSRTPLAGSRSPPPDLAVCSTVEGWLASRVESKAAATRPVWAGAAPGEDSADPGRESDPAAWHPRGRQRQRRGASDGCPAALHLSRPPLTGARTRPWGTSTAPTQSAGPGAHRRHDRCALGADRRRRRRPARHPRPGAYRPGSSLPGAVDRRSGGHRPSARRLRRGIRRGLYPPGLHRSI